MINKINNGRDELTRQKLSNVVPLKVPFNIQIEPTTLCNFKCEYCAQSTGSIKKKIMEWETFEKIICDLKNLSDDYKIINIIGFGEPLIHKRISDMVAEIKKASITKRVEITTNASLLTPEKSDELISAGLTRLIISLQGLNADMYKNICKYNVDYDDLINNIRYFYENKGACKLHIKIADTALGTGEEQMFYNMFSDICDDLYIEHIIPEFKDIDYTNKVKEERKLNRYGYEIKESIVCPQPFYQMFICADGNVSPCCLYPYPTIIGNVKRDSLKDIWNGELLKEFQILQLKKMRGSNSLCKHCILPEQAFCPQDNMDKEAEKLLEKFMN